MCAKKTGDSTPPCLIPLIIGTLEDPQGVCRRPVTSFNKPFQQFSSAPLPSLSSRRSSSFPLSRLSNAFSRSSLNITNGLPHSRERSNNLMRVNKKSDVCLPLPEHCAWVCGMSIGRARLRRRRLKSFETEDPIAMGRRSLAALVARILGSITMTGSFHCRGIRCVARILLNHSKR